MRHVEVGVESKAAARPEMDEASGWFDDVAFAAAQGPSPLVIAVCRQLHQAAELQAWLRSAIPAMAAMTVSNVCAAEVLTSFVRAPQAATAWIVSDAASGTDPELAARWQGFNQAREILRAQLLSHDEFRQALVFLVTVSRMPLICAQAPDLLSVAETITVTEEPFAVGADDASLVAAYKRAVSELETKYGLSTDELQDRLFDREPLPAGLSQVELNRWNAASQALRRL